MASPHDTVSMALFCDFENVALGVRDAQYDKFDIKPILERLLLKGSIVVKKAYCDWERYKGFKATMHEANFELIEIPHVRQSGKNSADIRLVVDALDLCYTKSHVNTFVIISGDSDFSPLVSKLRENAKQVIGVGVKQSTSDLLMANCDEFIFYDDLVRESQRRSARRQTPQDAQPPASRRTPEEERHRKEDLDARRNKAIDMAVETFDALVYERGDSGKIWASVLKEAIKRRRPDFNESNYGFRAFGNLLEEAQARGLLEFGRDEKSGAYVFRSSGMGLRQEQAPQRQEAAQQRQEPAASRQEPAVPRHEHTPQRPEYAPQRHEYTPQRRESIFAHFETAAEATPLPEVQAPAPALAPEEAGDQPAPPRRSRGRGGRKPASPAPEAATPTEASAEAPPSAHSPSAQPSAPTPLPAAPPEPPAEAAEENPVSTPRTSAARSRRPRKPAAPPAP